MEKGKLTWSKAYKAGHESPGEVCGQLMSMDESQFGFVPHRGTTDGSLCSQAAGRVSSCQQETAWLL